MINLGIRLTMAACALATASLSTPAGAQPFPNGVVRIVSAFPSGSGPDVVARLLANKMSTRWGQQVIIDAKPGAAGVSAINSMKRLPATGQDLVLVDVGNLVINPLIFKNLAYDPDKELTPVALVYKAAFFITVSANSPIKSVRDLKTAAASPAQLAYGSNAVGGPIHLASAQLASALGANMLHVPYKETSQLYTSVATDEVSWAYGSIATTSGLVRAGKLRLLAVADKARSPILPEVPTLEEAGGPKGIDALSWIALMAPAGTPSAVVNEINAAVNDALAQPDIKERYAAFGFAASPGPAQQVADMTREDRARYAEVLKHVKVVVD